MESVSSLTLYEGWMITIGPDQESHEVDSAYIQAVKSGPPNGFNINHIAIYVSPNGEIDDDQSTFAAPPICEYSKSPIIRFFLYLI